VQGEYDELFAKFHAYEKENKLKSSLTNKYDYLNTGIEELKESSVGEAFESKT